MGEAIFVVSLLALLVVPFAVVGLWWWFWTMLIIGLWVVAVEIVSKIKDRKTISQKFWGWSLENEKKAWIILSCMLLGWLILLLHLAWKIMA